MTTANCIHLELY